MNQSFDPAVVKQKGNVLFGALGAFLFAWAGGIIWYVLYQIGILAGLSGIVAVVCAIKGYSVFAKGESLRGVVIATVMSILVISFSWYLCLSMDVYEAYLEWFAAGDVDFTLTRWEAIANAWWFLTEPEIAFAYLKDLILGLLLCVVGCIAPIRNAAARAKAQAEPATFAASASDFTVSTDEASAEAFADASAETEQATASAEGVAPEAEKKTDDSPEELPH